MRKPFWKGLRIIDLCIFFFLICIVSGIVAWRYDDFKCRAMQSEAKFSLQEIYAAQKFYHAKNNRYAPIDTLIDIEKLVVIPKKYYTFADFSSPTQDSFSVVAIGTLGTVLGEKWSVNHSNEITLIKPVCRNDR